MHNKILFIGPVSPPVTGPGVKNKYIIDILHNYTKSIVIVQNTLGWKKHPINFLIHVIRDAIRSKQIWISVSKKGRIVFSILMYLLSYLIKIKYIIFPAGGSLDQEITNLPFLLRLLFIKALKKSDMILVESKSLKLNLEQIGFSNIGFFPNPRKDESHRWIEHNNTIKHIVFLSKIREGKGVLILLDALEKIKNIDFTLEYYGPIEDAFKEKFHSSLNRYEYASYGGIVDPRDVQKVLSTADVFVFPTLFDEGLPGVIVEASFTGVPLVTSRFKACDEYIENNGNGIIVSQGNADELSKAIENVLLDPALRKKLSQHFLKLSYKFNIDILMSVLIKDLKNKDWKVE